MKVKLVIVTTEAAKTMIVAFGLNQTEMTKAANTRRGIPKRMALEERAYISQLLNAITGHVVEISDIEDVIGRLG